MKKSTIVLLLCFFCDTLLGAEKLGAEKIVVYGRNLEKPFIQDTLNNLSSLTESEFGKILFISSQNMEQGRAFSELLKGNIDIFISAADSAREELAKVIYVPIDRGLLGFRVCLVNKYSTNFNTIKTPTQFIEKKLSIGLGSKWADKKIYEDNNFKVVTSPVYKSLFSMLEQKRFDCFSRSVQEVDAELLQYANTNITLDHNIAFIYPNSDFIYVNPNKPKLHRRLSIGMGKAIENLSYYEIFDKYFEHNLLKHNIYQRRLLVLKNKHISPEALSAINRFGIASFVINPIERSSPGE